MMRRAHFGVWLALCVSVSLACAQVPAPPSAPPPSSSSSPATAARNDRLLATRQTAFAIPFSINTANSKVAEVQLYVSTDLGINWHLYAKQKPGVGNFQFRAPRDGEYWFTSKTMDADGRVDPSGPFSPELKVLIDTVVPRLTFVAAVGPSGEVKTSWEAQDEHLDPKSLSIEYQPSPGANWEPVSIDGQSALAERGQLRGEVTWWPKTPAKTLTVKAEVRDLSGNPVVVNKRLFLPPLANRRPPQNATSANPNGTFASSPNTGGANTMVDPFSRYRDPANTAAPTGSAPIGGLAVGGAPINAAPIGGAPSNASPGSTMPLPVPPATLPNGSATNPGGIGQFVSSAKIPNIVPTQETPRPAANSTGGELPAGERPRMTNQKKFAIDYDIESAGPGGIEQIELWGTKDKGASWSRWSLDADKRSPHEVEVDAEGVFGFRIVVVSKSGLASPAPRAGDTADLWVGVDVTNPVAQFSSVSYGDGVYAGQLDIRWQADDVNLGSRPVSLLFAETPQGPWNSIASSLPNTGQYHWLVDARVPKKVFLKLEVRDEAGNTATHQLPEAINLAGLTPGARIRGVYAP